MITFDLKIVKNVDKSFPKHEFPIKILSNQLFAFNGISVGIKKKKFNWIYKIRRSQ